MKNSYGKKGYTVACCLSHSQLQAHRDQKAFENQKEKKKVL